MNNTWTVMHGQLERVFVDDLAELALKWSDTIRYAFEAGTCLWCDLDETSRNAVQSDLALAKTHQRCHLLSIGHPVPLFDYIRARHWRFGQLAIVVDADIFFSS